MSDHAGDIRALEKVSRWRRGQRISIDMGRRAAERDRTAPFPVRRSSRPDPAAERRAAEAEAASPPSRVPDAPWRNP
jgi:hypothetical protein